MKEIDIELAQRFVDQIDFARQEIKKEVMADINGVNEVFRLLRVVNNIRSKELAYALGVSRGKLSHMEQGRDGVSEKIISKYAEFFGLNRVSLMELVREVRTNGIRERYLVAMKMAQFLKEKA